MDIIIKTEDESCAILNILFDNGLQIGNIEILLELMSYEIVLQGRDYCRLFDYVCKKGYIEVVIKLMNDDKITSGKCVNGLLDACLNDHMNIVTEILWHRRVQQELTKLYNSETIITSDCALLMMLIRELDLILDVKEIIIKKLIV